MMRIQSPTQTSLNRLISQTDTLERLLRVISRVIQLYEETKRALESAASTGINKLHRQLNDTIEILGVMQSIQLVHELCEDKTIQSWQKRGSRICLTLYSGLRNLKWAEKLGFVHLGKLNSVLVGKLTCFKLATDCSYIFYRTFVIGECPRTKTCWRVVVSVGKIFVVVAELAIKAWNIHRFVCFSGLIVLNLALDCFIIKKRICHG